MRRRGRAKYSENGATKNVFIKGGEKFPYIFFMYQFLTQFSCLSHTRKAVLYNIKIAMYQCIMLFFMHAVRSPPPIHPLQPLTSNTPKNHAGCSARENIFHSHLDIFSVSFGLSPKAVLFGLSIILRGSNNKHLLLKCINCNENKNNNELKQLQHSRKASGK